MLEVSPCRDEAEEERSLALYNAVWPWDAVSMAEVRSFWDQAHDHVDMLAREGGEPVASAAVAVMPRRPETGLAMIAVPRADRRRGVGTACYRAVSEWLAARGISEMDAAVPEDDPASLAFAERRGFREVERNSRLVLELAGVEPPAIGSPDSVTITTWAERPELARGIYEVASEAYPDVPGERDALMEPFEDWLAHDMQGAGDSPEATFVALAGEEVVGYAKFSLTEAQPTVAFHDMTGVRRGWPGRGVAGALQRAQITWAKERGYERLVTQNEVRNEPIRRLNERHGYRPTPGHIVLERRPGG